MQPPLLGQAGTDGGTGRDNRRFVNAVVYRVRTGCAWRDLPERFGAWNTAAGWFRRWAKAGVWEPILQAVQEPGYAQVLVDLTMVKAHKAAAGQKKYSSNRMSRA
jgi:transposase